MHCMGSLESRPTKSMGRMCRMHEVNRLLIFGLIHSCSKRSPILRPSNIPSLARCRRENGLIRDPPLYPSFGPQNITVITSQKSHHRHVFLIRFPETHFPHSLKTETQLCHKMHPIPTILTVVHTSKSVQY